MISSRTWEDFFEDSKKLRQPLRRHIWRNPIVVWSIMNEDYVKNLVNVVHDPCTAKQWPLYDWIRMFLVFLKKKTRKSGFRKH